MKPWVGSALGVLTLGLFALAQAPPSPPTGTLLPPIKEANPLPGLSPIPHSGLQEAMEKLKTARQDLAQERKRLAPVGTQESSATQVQLQLRFIELLGRLEAKIKAPPPPPVPPSPKHGPSPFRPAPSGTEHPVTTPTPPSDPVLLAAYQFRANQFDATLRTIAGIDAAGLTARDRVWLQYLKGCCLRRQGKLPQAGVLYREVADNRIDPFLAESAIWHLASLKWREEMLAGIAKTRPPEK